MGEHVTINEKGAETTEIICILDRSTSIRTSGLIEKTIEGFNAFLADQKKLPGKATLTLCLFDGGLGFGNTGQQGETYEIVHDGIDLQDVPELNATTFVPKGMTAMYDAIGVTIDNVYDRVMKSESRPDKIIVLIMTDGEENSSREYTRDQVAELIKRRTEDNKWAFIFIGANIDTMRAGSSLSVSKGNTLAYTNTSQGVNTAYFNMSASVGKFRSASFNDISDVNFSTNLVKDNDANKEKIAGQDQ